MRQLIKHDFIGDENDKDVCNNFNSSWMMKLSQGEEVHLKVYINTLYADPNMPLIFTGNLLKLDD